MIWKQEQTNVNQMYKAHQLETRSSHQLAKSLLNRTESHYQRELEMTQSRAT